MPSSLKRLQKNLKVGEIPELLRKLRNRLSATRDKNIEARELPSKRTVRKYFLSEEESIERIRLHLAKRRASGELPEKLPERPRLFAAVNNSNWEKTGLVDSWESLADVVHFDWGDPFDQYKPDWQDKGKYEFNKVLLEKVEAEHKANPLHIFFSYHSGRWLFPKTVQDIGKLGIITINFGFDDTLKFWDRKTKTGWAGNAAIAAFYDFCIFCSRELDIVKYNEVGANGLFIPPGGNQVVFGAFEPAETRKYGISFIGQNYGIRKKYIDYLRNNGIDVFVRGMCWPGGEVSQDEMLNVYRNSLMTLGFGYISDTKVKQLKGRDIENPMLGAAYITTYCDELAKFFVPDKEIIFYKDKKELLRKVKYYQDRPEEAIAIGAAGRARALKEHTWDKRWAMLLDICRTC